MHSRVKDLGEALARRESESALPRQINEVMPEYHAVLAAKKPRREFLNGQAKREALQRELTMRCRKIKMPLHLRRPRLSH
jgi:hypothetical protein